MISEKKQQSSLQKPSSKKIIIEPEKEKQSTSQLKKNQEKSVKFQRFLTWQIQNVLMTLLILIGHLNN